MKKFFAIISSLFLLFVGAISYIYLTQEQRIFISKPLADTHVFEFDTHFEELYFDVGEGARVHALLFTTDAPKGTVLYFHGRGENLESFWGEVSTDFIERGYNVLIPDYRKSGKSTGNLSQKAILADGTYIFDELQRRYPDERIILYGCSLGTSVATYVASQRPIKMLLLESPFFSLIDEAPKNAPIFLPKFLIPMIMRFPLPTHEWIQGVSAPIHIFHGTKDTTVPHEASLRLMDLLQDHPEISFTSLEDATHGSVRSHPTYRLTLDSLLLSEAAEQALEN